MIKFLTRLKRNFILLTWINTLVEAKLITSAFARIFEWAIFTVYCGIIAFLIMWIKTWDWSQWLSSLDVLASWFAITILSAILMAFRNHKTVE
jgi:hypothetical protein